MKENNNLNDFYSPFLKFKGPQGISTRTQIFKELPIIFSKTSDELITPEEYSELNEESRKIASAQLATKKFQKYENDSKTNLEEVLTERNVLGEIIRIQPQSLHQNGYFDYDQKDKQGGWIEGTSPRIGKIAASFVKENMAESFIEKLYTTIIQQNPEDGETFHIAENGDKFLINYDLKLVAKQRTARATSSSIGRFVQQPSLVLDRVNYSSPTKGKVILLDDHIQTGSAIYSSVNELSNNGYDVIAVGLITGSLYSIPFLISREVKDFILKLVNSENELNEALGIAGLQIDSLTNAEGILLSAILFDPVNNKDEISALMKKFKVTDCEPLFKETIQDSYLKEVEKEAVSLEQLKKELSDGVRDYTSTANKTFFRQSFEAEDAKYFEQQIQKNKKQEAFTKDDLFIPNKTFEVFNKNQKNSIRLRTFEKFRKSELPKHSRPK